MLATLAALDDWTTMENALLTARRATNDADKAAEIVKGLIEQELAVVEDSPAAERDQQYRDNWRWGAVAGWYQFSLRDQEFLEGEQTEDRMRKYREVGDMPPVLATHEGIEDRIELPNFDLEDPFFAELHARRSSRKYSGGSISLKALASCLFAANGVTSVNEHGPFGVLPKTMTPSGGARNPYELYVYARAVTDVAPGFYHYSALDHDLAPVNTSTTPRPIELLGTQKWTNDAAAIVFMVATFERMAWKYRQPLAWRVVLMETGYIAQNLLLAANHLGLAAAPTGALAESRIEEIIGVDGLQSAAIFAVVIGDPA
ncbi:MAG: SagB/ThcOx family dehydrogenase [Xanthomonadales bacterium]|nr:SagB/ThcOx family dehydrogenase [Xanthomonadales bacterium]